MPLPIDRSTLLVPDVMVLFKPFDQACSGKRRPAVVVEVLSGDTQARDRGEKWLKYASLASLQHYLLIATDDQRIEAFSRWTPPAGPTAPIRTGSTPTSVCRRSTSAS